jgi:N-methylhydantoinase B
MGIHLVAKAELGKLIAWTANIAHNSDVGGMAPGSLSGAATEIFQKGLRLPAVKLISKGEVLDGVMDIITTNSRMPDYLPGDVWAAIASVRVGARRQRGFGQLCRGYPQRRLG